jgi:hypothetical protein
MRIATFYGPVWYVSFTSATLERFWLFQGDFDDNNAHIRYGRKGDLSEVQETEQLAPPSKLYPEREPSYKLGDHGNPDEFKSRTKRIGSQ